MQNSTEDQDHGGLTVSVRFQRADSRTGDQPLRDLGDDRDREIGMSAMIGAPEDDQQQDQIRHQRGEQPTCSALLPDCWLSSCWSPRRSHAFIKPAPLISVVNPRANLDRVGGRCVPSVHHVVGSWDGPEGPGPRGTNREC